MTTRPTSPASESPDSPKNSAATTGSAIDSAQFRRELRRIALPVTLQYLLQSSFSVVDQIMIGQLGTVSVAAIGIAASFVGLYNTLVFSVAGAASIIMAQSTARGDARQSGKAFYTSLSVMSALALVFATLCIAMPARIMGLYSTDPATIAAAAPYIRIYALGFIPQVVENIIAVYLRCTDAAKVPLYAGIGAAVTNTALNFVLIFGTPVTPAYGVQGAAWASMVSQCVACAVVLWYFVGKRNAGRVATDATASAGRGIAGTEPGTAAEPANAADANGSAAADGSTAADRAAPGPAASDPTETTHADWGLVPALYRTRGDLRMFGSVLAPMVAGDFLWQLGNNVYASVYGHLSTNAMAAMTLINPMTTLVFGALAGLAQAALLMVGHKLGEGDERGAYATSCRLLRDGFVAAIAIAVIVVLLRGAYVQIFQVDDAVRDITQQILVVFAIMFPLRVVNMIMSSGVLRSGGKTSYIMAISLLGTWCVGVPLSLISGFALHWSVVGVYAMVSQEETAKTLISLPLFRSRKWMRQL